MKFLLFYNSLATFCTSVLLLLFVFFRTKPDHRPEAPSTTHVQLALVMTTVGVALWLLYIQKAITGLSTVDVTNGFSGHRESRFPSVAVCGSIERAVWTTMQPLTSLFHSLMLDAGVRRRFDE
ncbi:hypothetical protein T4E_8352 [Trichinella pseudospiralis]|uniref:Uncharacterized protein n=1 Tax=Trichinella pseudospiralis TaxID=6337 RepID=A0A0V0XQZ0_TRIPS|nr:hypothetical protein T4E_8352 [Trichinella pseudospiralis]